MLGKTSNPFVLVSEVCWNFVCLKQRLVPCKQVSVVFSAVEKLHKASYEKFDVNYLVVSIGNICVASSCSTSLCPLD